jgi:hypothetical protein
VDVKASSWLAAGQAVPVGQGVKGARPMPSRPPNVKGFEFANPQLAKHACMHQVSVHFFFPSANLQASDDGRGNKWMHVA